MSESLFSTHTMKVNSREKGIRWAEAIKSLYSSLRSSPLDNSFNVAQSVSTVGTATLPHAMRSASCVAFHDAASTAPDARRGSQDRPPNIRLRVTASNITLQEPHAYVEQCGSDGLTVPASTPAGERC